LLPSNALLAPSCLNEISKPQCHWGVVIKVLGKISLLSYLLVFVTSCTEIRVGNVNQSRLLPGSSTGIAHSSPFVDGFPSVVYPTNLTPDLETSLGSWTMNRFIQMIRVGTTDHSSRSLPVMPWPAFLNITEENAFAIAAYLKSLIPVRHKHMLCTSKLWR
jgi:hypothetical protein